MTNAGTAKFRGPNGTCRCPTGRCRYAAGAPDRGWVAPGRGRARIAPGRAGPIPNPHPPRGCPARLAPADGCLAPIPRQCAPGGRLVEALLRFLETVGRERLDSVRRSGYKGIHVRLRVELREHVVRDGAAVAASRPPHADPEAEEVVRPQR